MSTSPDPRQPSLSLGDDASAGPTAVSGPASGCASAPPSGSAPAGPASGVRAPLAERLRPRRLDEVVGQEHLVGPGKPLRVAFEARRPYSMILWGPPGVGKTTLARLMADAFGARFLPISAVLGGVREIREAVALAQEAAAAGQRSIVFVDEVHRFNKAQQDAFLPHVESGLFVFVGATTENPSFEVNSALLSRARVHVLEPVGEPALDALFGRALSALAGEQAGVPVFEADARARLVAWADGDARRLLNAIESVVDAALAQGDARIDTAFLGRALSENLRRFDKGGDAFYDQISALHKSVRGSHPDAALYWLARMLDGGADPRYTGRRIVRMAIEDVGLADPRALRLALDAAEVYERLGSPEGELALAQAVVYLACAAKSNAGYSAWNAARAFVSGRGSEPVPVHLRNAPTRLMKSLGHGRDYRYAHDETHGYAAGERYMPDGVDEPRFYRPTDRGLEARIAEKLRWLRGLDEEAAAASPPPTPGRAPAAPGADDEG
jgi:putative ATPase